MSFRSFSAIAATSMPWLRPREQLDQSGTRATVTYRIDPGEQSRVESFNINVSGFDPTGVKALLLLQPGAPFTREALGSDTKKVRQALINQRYLSPLLEDARVERDPEKNLITINLTGKVGPKVSVLVPDYPMKEQAATDLLPVKREGNIDQSAIIEGARRLRNKLQEQGYFFTEVTPVCTVTPPTPELGENGTAATCETLNPENLSGRTVEIRYDIERGRRFKLTDIRITGTNKLTYEDVAADLRTQKASALGLIPLLGYGRGYTSLTLLEQDKRTIRNYMRDLGYRRAEVDVLQGVSINGESLIITFQVNEGPLTRIAGVEVRGNKIYTDQRLRDELKTVIGSPYSRSQARADGERMMALYAREGYVSAQMEFSIVELPKKGEEEQVRLIYSITNEGDKVYINRIVVNGVTGSAKDATHQARRNPARHSDCRGRRAALGSNRRQRARALPDRRLPAGHHSHGTGGRNSLRLQAPGRHYRRGRKEAARDGLRRRLLDRHRVRWACLSSATLI